MEEPILQKDSRSFPDDARAAFIAFGLDDYDDIFSDFDPQPYSERMLSEDFLNELRRAALGKGEAGLTLTLQLPKDRRNGAHEKVILERLKGHFRRQRKRREEAWKKETRMGTWMVALGMACMFLATYLLYRFERSLLTAFVIVLLEPAGWFTFWEGLNLLLFRPTDGIADLAFYRKLSGAKVAFASTPVPPALENPRPKEKPAA